MAPSVSLSFPSTPFHQPCHHGVWFLAMAPSHASHGQQCWGGEGGLKWPRAHKFVCIGPTMRLNWPSQWDLFHSIAPPLHPVLTIPDWVGIYLFHTNTSSSFVPWVHWIQLIQTRVLHGQCNLICIFRGIISHQSVHMSINSSLEEFSIDCINRSVLEGALSLPSVLK